VRAIIVGARGATRDLLRRLSERWQVVVIDHDPDLLARARSVRDVETIQGDGSSRVVLERAGVAEAEAVVAASGDDATNLEVCRIALAAGVRRVAGVPADAARMPEYRSLGVPAFSPDTLTARGLETVLEPRRISSTTFADGKAEAIEFRLGEDSPLRGMTLRDLHSESYLVAAILRGEQFIVPHGDTSLQGGDLVTVVGSAADFSRIVATFTSGTARFPLDFGKGVLAVVIPGNDIRQLIGEAVDLTRNSPAESLVVLYQEPAGGDTSGSGASSQDVEEIRALTRGLDAQLRPVSGDPRRHVGAMIATENIGVVVLATPPPAAFGAVRAARSLRRSQAWQRPVMFARGTHPYREVIAPARDTPSGLAAARAAIDLAADGRASLTGVAVVPPAFVVGSDEREHAMRALGRMREEAAVLDVTVRREVQRGNPVRLITAAANAGHLLVVGMPHRRPTLLTLGIVPHLLARVEVSVLVVPYS